MCPVIPLTMMQEGKEGKVSHINAGWGLTRRLVEMGFVKGARVKLLRGGLGGPVIVSVNGCKYALGRGMAMKIMVEDRE